MNRIRPYILYTFLFTTVFSLCLSCNKSIVEIYDMPEQTETGANTMGFILGAIPWTNQGKYCYNQYGGCRDNPMATFEKFRGG